MRSTFLKAILLVALFLIAARALNPAGYQIHWWTADGGGGVSEGGNYSLSATIGQADAGLLSGGDYQLAGGFWGGASATYNLNLPLVLR